MNDQRVKEVPVAIIGTGSNPYVHVSPIPVTPSGASKGPMEKVCGVLDRCSKKIEKSTRKAEFFADSVWNHLRTSPSFTDAAMVRLVKGTRVLAEGGHDKLFQQTFEILPGEKLIKPYACYLSTSSGPVIGTIYISTKRIAFCSDHPLCHYPSLGQSNWLYYKVVLLLDQLRTVEPSANRLNPSEKYIHVVTSDGHEFWFMGFISYDKALKNLNKALQQSHD
ncbi:GLABRA2 expression modulator [Quillaja saponaria]|uniref:GLABRA2 expression modulator n=1 Tax=Quillaja saponaria TaxID=32244 RepID=A0AAD7PAW7_QUISA|nr:GLABRA2 expression modulator [Quillaja saponaria]